MGQLKNYFCPLCGYKYEAYEGGGFVSKYRIFVCHACLQLQNIDCSSADEEHKCPRCLSKNVVPWTDDHVCPRCGEHMVLDKDTPIICSD